MCYTKSETRVARWFGLAGLALVLGLVVGAGCRTAARNSLAIHDSAKWENSIRQFERQDLTNRPPTGCIVFTGSSFIRLWTNLVEDFPRHPVVNRGFGGCQLADVYHYADRMIIPYAPRQVVIYAGGNDINAGKPPEVVYGDFVALMQKLRTALPKTDLVFISCPPSPKRWEQTDRIREVNRRIARYCARNGLTYVNAFDAMLGPDGQPRPEIYVEDRLHMNASGYAIWRDLVAPHLR